MRPWLWQNRIMVATGNFSIWSVGQLQMQPSMGKKYQSRNASPKRCSRKKSPRGCISAASACFSAMRVHRERHVRLGGLHAQLGQQADQVGVGALVEPQKAGVHPVGDGGARGIG